MLSPGLASSERSEEQVTVLRTHHFLPLSDPDNGNSALSPLLNNDKEIVLQMFSSTPHYSTRV